MTSREAVEFFASKIELQAKSEGVHLTQAEKLMLRFSEVEPDGVKDLALAAQFEDDDKANEYDERMGALLLRSYEAEQNTPELNRQWIEARNALKGHDYYIWVMVWEVFPETMPNVLKRKPSSTVDYLLYIAVGLAVVGTVVYFALSSR